MVSRMNLVWVI